MNYRINEPRVAHETIDNETIIIDFETGVYFSARAEANLIWQALCKGYTPEVIIEFVAARFKNDAQEISIVIKQFVAQLLERELILVNVDEQVVTENTSDPAPGNFNLSTLDLERFTEPVLETHTDMQQLLLLDPVHDINAKGWPNKK